MSRYEPSDNLVLIEIEKRHEETVGSVVIPDSAQEISAVGRVLARGPLAYDIIKVGVRVLFQPYLVEEAWTEDGQRLALVLDTNIYACIAEEGNGAD